MKTPWGPSNEIIEFPDVPGLMRVHIAGQQVAFKLAGRLNAKMPWPFRREGGWYKAPVESALVMIMYPKLFNPVNVNEAHRIVMNAFPDEYQAVFNRPVKLEESQVLRERADHKRLRGCYVASSAYGEWHEAVPAGYVGVVCCRVGDMTARSRAFLVPRNEYDHLGNRCAIGCVGFVATDRDGISAYREIAVSRLIGTRE